MNPDDSKLLREAMRGATISATVEAEVPGGFQLTADGREFFLPGSQAAPEGDSTGPAVGSQVDVALLKVGQSHFSRGEWLEVPASALVTTPVVSVRAVIEREAAARAAATLRALAVGDVVPGVVDAVHAQVAFVDLGGLVGVAAPVDGFEVGATVRVRVTAVDKAARRVRLEKA